MSETNFNPRGQRAALVTAFFVCALALSGCVNAGEHFSPGAVASMSPAAQVVGPLESVRLAMEYVAAHPGADFMAGSGDSMQPLYRDHTLVIIEPVPMSRLKAGMTVVFLNESGLPVAHVLVRRDRDGWIAMGVNNPECDTGRVREGNLLGVVVKAIEPTSSPMLALIEDTRPASAGLLLASNP